MKLLFLDIDGVVNCKSTTQRMNGFIGVDPELMQKVKHIKNMTGCQVVLSSTWRLNNASFMDISRRIALLGATKNLSNFRGDEIREFMSRKPYKDCVYAILDDDSDFYPDQPHFKTSFDTGITDEIVKKVIKHLGEV